MEEGRHGVMAVRVEEPVVTRSGHVVERSHVEGVVAVHAGLGESVGEALVAGVEAGRHGVMAGRVEPVV